MSLKVFNDQTVQSTSCEVEDPVDISTNRMDGFISTSMADSDSSEHMDSDRAPLLRESQPSTPCNIQESGSDDDERKASAAATSAVTPLLMGAALSAAIGTSAQFGYAISMLDNIEAVVISDYQLGTNCSVTYDVKNSASGSSKQMFELATAVFCAGGLVGALLGGWLAEVAGRKYSMIFNNIFSVLCGFLMVFSTGFPMLIGGRFVQGLASGIGLVTVPVYLSEIAPTSARGAVGILNQVMITVAIFAATVVGLPYLLGTCDRWPLVVGVPVVFSALQLISLPFFPRSPRYLYIQKNNVAAAKLALRRLRGKGADLSAELLELKEEKYRQDQAPKMSAIQVLLDPNLRSRLLLTAIEMMAQQLTGINGVFYYSAAIYTDAGLKNVSLIVLVPTIINILLGLFSVRAVERLGRRKLMLMGLAGMAASHAILAAGFCFQDGFFSNSKGANWTSVLTIGGSLGVVIFFAVGPGPIPWMILSELFPQSSRATAYSFGGVINWTSNYLIGQFFLQILEGASPYGFAVFAAVSLFFTIAVYCFQPETKGKEIEKIDSFFRREAEADRRDSGFACCLPLGRKSID